MSLPIPEIVEQTKYPIPEYLYDDQLLNDIQYVLNKDVLLQYGGLRPLVDPEPTNWSHIYASWWTEGVLTIEDWALRNYEQAAQEGENGNSKGRVCVTGGSQSFCQYLPLY